jgi:hypothetical protein
VIEDLPWVIIVLGSIAMYYDAIRTNIEVKKMTDRSDRKLRRLYVDEIFEVMEL